MIFATGMWTALVGVGQPRGAAAQLTGVVVDPGGRPLPYAVVTSRTGNGFLALPTDVRGQFTFPGRPHRAGDRLEVRYAGFRSAERVVADGDSLVTIVMHPSDTRDATGWTVGLPVDPRLRIERTDGSVLGPADSARIDEAYRFAVSAGAPETCVRAGPSGITSRDGAVVVVMTVFVADRQCAGAGPVSADLRHVFTAAGTVEIRVAGRRRDVVRRVMVGPS